MGAAETPDREEIVGLREETYMLRRIVRHIHWLRGQRPAGHVERLPQLDEHGRPNGPDVYVPGPRRLVLENVADSSCAGIDREREQRNAFQIADQTPNRYSSTDSMSRRSRKPWHHSPLRFGRRPGCATLKMRRTPRSPQR